MEMGVCQICDFIISYGHAFGVFRCNQQCINALVTYQRHVPMLWRWHIRDLTLLPAGFFYLEKPKT